MPDQEPFRFELPDGSTFEIPAEIPMEERNKLITDVLIERGFAEEPKRIPLPPVTAGPIPGMVMPDIAGPRKIKESTARTISNIVGEEAVSAGLGGLGVLAGGATTVPTGGLLNPGSLGLAGRAVGAPIGRKLISEPIQRAWGVEPEKFGMKDAALLAGMTAGGEGLAQGASKGLRSIFGLLGSTPGRASRESARYWAKLYRESGIDAPSPGSILQSKALQGTTGLAQKSMYAAGVTTEFLEAQEEAVLKNIIGRTGAQTAETAGEALTTGLNRAMKEFNKQAKVLFDEVRRLVPPRTQIMLTDTRKILDEELYRRTTDIVTAAGGTKLVGIAKRIDKAMAAGQPVTFEDLTRMRTFLGRQIPKATTGAERGELRRLYGAITDDIEASFSNNPDIGQAAVDAWRSARNHYKEGIKTIDDFYSKISGKITPEEAIYVLEGYATGQKTNITRLREIRGALTDAEWQPFEDWFIRRNLVTGDGQFVGFQGFLNKAKDWTDEMMDTMFGVGTPNRKWMGDLRKIARNEERFGIGSVSKNPLMTVSEVVGPIGEVVGPLGVGAGVLAVSNPFLALFAAASYPMGMYGMGRLLTSGKILKWVIEGAKVNPSGLAAHLGSLAGIVANEDPEMQELAVEFFQNLRSLAEPGVQGFQPDQNLGLLANPSALTSWQGR